MKSVFDTDEGKELVGLIREHTEEFAALLNNPDQKITKISSDELFTLFTEGFRIKMIWYGEGVEADREEVHVIRELVGSLVDFLCAEIIRRHKERIL